MCKLSKNQQGDRQATWVLSPTGWQGGALPACSAPNPTQLQGEHSPVSELEALGFCPSRMPPSQ